MLFLLAFSSPAMAEQCCQDDSKPVCCCPSESMEETQDCVPSICSGQDFSQQGVDVSLFLTTVSYSCYRQPEIELEPEALPRPQSQPRSFLIDDRPPPLSFIDETFYNLPPPAFASLM